MEFFLFFVIIGGNCLVRSYGRHSADGSPVLIIHNPILFKNILTINVPQKDRFLWHFSYEFFLAYLILGLLDEE